MLKYILFLYTIHNVYTYKYITAYEFLNFCFIYLLIYISFFPFIIYCCISFDLDPVNKTGTK